MAFSHEVGGRATNSVAGSLYTETSLRVVTAAVLCLALLLGGGTHQGLWSDAIVQLASLLLLGVLLPVLLRPAFFTHKSDVVAFVLVIGLLPLLQLIPLPPAMWTLLPGRGDISAAYGAADMSVPWLPISLDPAATWRSFLALAPPVAVFLATVFSGFRTRRSLSLLIIAAGIVSVLLGLAQLMQGPTSPLRFYPITNPGNSVGFFANRNHYAALLYSVIPFTTAWIVGLLIGHRIDRIFGLAVAILVYAALILGLGMALSRAGIFLAVVAALASLLLVATHQQRIARHGFIIIGGAIALGAVSIIQFALFNLLGRFDDDILADYRVTIAHTTIEAAKAFQPFGSGFGTFVPTYQMFEHIDALEPVFANHAHNDWLELWLEGSWPALAILATFLLWLAFASVRAWQPHHDDARTLDRAIAQAGSIVIVLLLMHSAVDYPLHTTALMTLFAFCCGLLVEPQRLIQQRDPNQNHRPHDEPHLRRGSSFFQSHRNSNGWQRR